MVQNGDQGGNRHEDVELLTPADPAGLFDGSFGTGGAPHFFLLVNFG
jgi:hypothetical protein